MLNKVWQLFLRDARTALSYPLNFWSQWVAIPIGVTGLWFVSKLIPPSHHFGFGGRTETYFSYVVLNVAFWGFQNNAMQSFQNSIRLTQMVGVLESLLVTPTNLPLLVIASSLWSFALTAARVAVYLLTATLVFHLSLNQANPQSMLIVLALMVTCMSSIGILGAASIMTFKQTSPAGVLFSGASQVLTGVLFPIALLPAWLQHVSQWLPLTHALNAIRAGAHGASVAQMMPDVLWLGYASAILLPTSLAVFARSVRRAKYDGTLGQY